MQHGLNISERGDLDFVSVGALVHRLDPGIIPFRKATECLIHVSGGEFNTAANLADCFKMRTGIATAMVDYPIGDLIASEFGPWGLLPSTSASNMTGRAARTWQRCTAIAVTASGRRSSSTIEATKRPRS